MLTISENKKTLLKDEKPFFYLADTCWSAFTNITDDEWDYYLYKRKVQGFNTIQINILPQWDASATDLVYEPFVDHDPYQINDAYFEHAKEMCKKAKAQGFELALVVLWCNYVPGTWASNFMKDHILPFDCLDGYITKVDETFSEFQPMYVISGDTDFETDETISYYVKAAATLKKLAPKCLYTTHIKGRYTYIPENLYAYLDFLFYQSGHNAQDLSMPYSLSETMQQTYPDKPLINSEPCYEEMGYSRQMYGRWTRYDVRRAAYVSVLSGACAGITYGAGGIYSWHKVNKSFAKFLGEGFDDPKSWEEAMAFPGAWDYGYLKTMLENLNIQSLEARQDLLLNDTNDIRVAKANNGIYLVYVPCNTKVRLDLDCSAYKLQTIDLENRFVANTAYEIKEGKTILAIHPFQDDVLVVIKK
ncbi:uncharacterized protein DUF4038 [Breznakia blatticola]|uniref:Uncharacterized protein DUF4038 n=1 Tax=Breznakia blatticola TaxID=1754012 RepID=A0A4V3G659_9FIRM|nr:DUF4038 domain-containing protein [Breznakia blatticola]TDW13237.1 uncharacterized protein DUF4038 [Breznakia blatticola]